MMKREFRIYGLGLLSVLMLSSCITTTKTARTATTSASIKNATVADLRVTDNRVTYTMSPSKAIQRAGLNNVKQAAIQEALTKNGNADVMVEPEFVIEKERTLFGSHISSITVTGRPAYYQKFRTLPDSVWHKPGFYGQPDVVRVCSCNGDDCEDCGDFAPKRGGIAGLVGKLSGKNKSQTKIEREDTGWRRSGFGGHLTAIGGNQKWKVNEHQSYNQGRWFDVVEDNSGDPYIGGLLTLGYNVSSHFFLGAGSGVMYGEYKDFLNVPIFADIRYNFSGHKVSTLFFDYKIGGNVIANKSDYKGGVFLGLALGYDFGHFEISAQYLYTQVDTKDKIRTGYDDYSYSAKWNLYHMGICLGIAF